MDQTLGGETHQLVLEKLALSLLNGVFMMMVFMFITMVTVQELQGGVHPIQRTAMGAQDYVVDFVYPEDRYVQLDPYLLTFTPYYRVSKQ